MPELGSVSRAEWRRVCLFALAVMLLTTLPYGLAWLSAGNGWRFGGVLFGAEDGYSYLAKMRLGVRGDWSFTMRYTSEAHDPAFLFLPHIALGHLVGLLWSESDPALMTALAVAYHVARVVFGFVLLLISYRFAALFVREPATRFLALVLIALGGGLGWLLTLVGLGSWYGSLPVDFYLPEGYSFLILFGLPHLALARSALLLGFLLLFRSLSAPDDPRQWLGYALLAGTCWAIVGFCVSFYIPLIYLLLGSWGLSRWVSDRRFPWPLFWRAASAALLTLPYLIYSTVVFLTDDVLGMWAEQNKLPSPHVLHYLMGYGVLAVPAALAARWAWRRSSRDSWLPHNLLVVWVVVALLAVYLPINVQRRLAEAVLVPLSILAAVGLRLAFPHRRPYRRARAVLLSLTLPTSLLLWAGGLSMALTPERPLFRPQAEINALACLDRVAPRDAVVLSTMESGAVLPVLADVRAYVGHGPETVDSDAKAEQARQFFAGELAPAAREMLLTGVDYVFVGPLEQADPMAADPSWAMGLRPVPGCARDNVVIYEVVRD